MDEFNRDDLIELIIKDGGVLKYTIFRKKMLKLAVKTLQNFTANIRLDYHGVADLTDINENLVSVNDRDKYSICVISYLGTHSEKRLTTRENIIKRIESGQINFGIINFVRCDENKLCNTFHEPGSKAWINSLIKTGNNAIFIDDSIDHFQSVRTMNITNLTSIFFKGNKEDLFNMLTI